MIVSMYHVFLSMYLVLGFCFDTELWYAYMYKETRVTVIVPLRRSKVPIHLRCCGVLFKLKRIEHLFQDSRHSTVVVHVHTCKQRGLGDYILFTLVFKHMLLLGYYQ